MQPFRTHKGLVAVLDRIDVDTDQIIPKQFLKRIERTGFGQFLFYDWRFLGDGSLNPEFELNQDRFQGATILLAGSNFGCGIVTGTCPLGATGLWFSGSDRSLIRRYFLQQLLQERASADPPTRECGRSAPRCHSGQPRLRTGGRPRVADDSS